MKIIITKLLLLVMLTQAFSKMLIIISYQTNKNYIIEFFCINNSKPQLQCEGVCFLKKELKNAEQAEQPLANNNQKQQLDITLHYQDLFSLICSQNDKEHIYYSWFLSGAISKRVAAILRPPQILV